MPISNWKLAFLFGSTALLISTLFQNCGGYRADQDEVEYVGKEQGLSTDEAFLHVALKASGALVFEDSFESTAVGKTINPNINVWGNCSGNCLIVTDQLSRSGQRSAMAYLNRLQSKSTYRTESVVRPVADLDMGAEVWYGFSIYIPKDHKWTNDDGESLMQFHNNKDQNLGEDKTGDPPTILRLLNKRWKLNNQYSTDPITTKENKKNVPATYVNAEAGKWSDWVFHVKWSWKSDGIFQAWKDGKLIREYKGPNCYNDAKAPKLKLGIYKRAWENPNDTSGKLFDPSVVERTFYYDEVRAAIGPNATYEDVAPGGTARAPASINEPQNTGGSSSTPIPTDQPSNSGNSTNSKANLIISSPLNGEVFEPKSKITMVAETKDKPIQVEFYVDNKLICTDKKAPFKCNYKLGSKKNKKYNIKVKAQMTKKTAEEQTLTIIGSPNQSQASVTTPASTSSNGLPILKIVSPKANSTFKAGSSITIKAKIAQKGDSAVKYKVNFYVNGKSVCTDTQSPYECKYKLGSKKGVTYKLMVDSQSGSDKQQGQKIITVKAK